jgi:hypothetical protein
MATTANIPGTDIVFRRDRDGWVHRARTDPVRDRRRADHGGGRRFRDRAAVRPGQLDADRDQAVHPLAARRTPGCRSQGDRPFPGRKPRDQATDGRAGQSGR